MKNTKRLLSVVLALALLCCLSIPAFADEAQYGTTQDFLNAIEAENGLECSLNGIFNASSGYNYEVVKITYEGELSEYRSNFVALFAEDGGSVEFDMYNVIDFAEEDLAEVMQVINNLNANSSGMKLYVDTSDNSVTAVLYLLTTPASTAELAYTGLFFTIGFTDSLYEQLQDYAI